MARTAGGQRERVSRGWIGRVAIALVCCAAGARSRAGAQSLTAGDVGGTVQDSAGRAVSEALVTLTDAASGLPRTASGTRAGRYRLTLVPPGEYNVLVERLGYRPVRVLGVLVRSGASVDVSVTLTPAVPPVTRVDTVRFGGGVGAGAGQWFSPIAVQLLPHAVGELTDLGRLSAIADSDLATEGLSGSLSALFLDGALYRPARHPALAGGQFDAATLPLSSFDQAELAAGSSDVEWAGVGGGMLSGFSRVGTPTLEPHVFADWSGNALSDSKYFNTGAAPNAQTRGALMITGPLSRDSVQFVVGVEGRRLETPLPAAWPAGALADSIVAVARDSFSTSVSDYLTPRSTRIDAVSVFGGINWQPPSGNHLVVDGRYASATIKNPDLGLGPAPSLGASLDTKDVVASATFSSSVSRDVSQELRLGVESSTRTYAATTPTATTFAELGAPLGSDPALPGRFQRTAVRASETFYHQVGAHRLKLGATFAFTAYDQTYGFGGTGEFFFSGPGDFALRRGVFVQHVFAAPAAQFTVPELGLFLQDVISAAPGLDLQIGLRYDHEALPRSKVSANAAWLNASGLDNTQFGAGLNKLSPRAVVRWDVGPAHMTHVQGALGLYYDQVDPGILGDLITQSLGDRVRRGLGSLAAWPTPPDSARAPSAGVALTLLAPKIQAPRSGRASLGVWRTLGNGLVAELSGTYRHTDYLPRRHDLNLPLAPAAHDQYGRPIYGTLVQQGGLLAVRPGSNRRLSGFDLVSGIDPDGYSDYWGVTLGLERQVGTGVHVLASYTYSRTTDNWLSARAGDPVGQLSPFPDSLGGQDWAKGRSDFDVPHRVVVAAEFEPHVAMAPRVAVIYRYRSGYAFTPSFRNGVDANGDGSATNDPVFVDAALPGMSSVLSQWDCLRGQVGRFAERNGCREPGVQALDLRASFAPLHAAGYPVEVVVDALNVLESDYGLRDHALYLVDQSRTISTNPATGVVSVPLVVNPSFGQVLVRRTTGRALRVGVRVNY